MEKKTKIVLAVVVVTILIISGVLFFVVLQEKKNDPLSNLGYSNAEERYGFNPPSEWSQVEEVAGAVYFNYTTNEYSSEPLWLIVGAYTPVGYEETLDYYVNGTLEEFANSTLENFSIISHNERTVNGMDAYEFVSTYDYYSYDNQTKYERKVKLVWVEKNERVFGIQYAGRPNLYDIHESVVEQSINSLTII